MNFSLYDNPSSVKLPNLNRSAKLPKPVSTRVVIPPSAPTLPLRSETTAKTGPLAVGEHERRAPSFRRVKTGRVLDNLGGPKKRHWARAWWIWSVALHETFNIFTTVWFVFLESKKLFLHPLSLSLFGPRERSVWQGREVRGRLSPFSPSKNMYFSVDATEEEWGGGVFGNATGFEN